MNPNASIPILQFLVQRAVCAAVAVAITLLTTQTIVASAQPQYQAVTAGLATRGEGLPAASITVALAR